MIATGTPAPDAVLPTPDGAAVRLADEFAAGAVLLAFFKRKCPTSPLVMPKIPRFADAYPALRIWAVSQDNHERTQAFLDEHAPGTQVLLDHPDFTASRAYDMDAVPALVLVTNGTVESVMVGWDRGVCFELSTACAQATDAPYVDISPEGDGPDWQAACTSNSV